MKIIDAHAHLWKDPLGLDGFAESGLIGQAWLMPILFHVGIILKNTRKEMTPAQSWGPTNMRPSMLDGIAAAFPDLPLIQGHMDRRLSVSGAVETVADRMLFATDSRRRCTRRNSLKISSCRRTDRTNGAPRAPRCYARMRSGCLAAQRRGCRR